MSFGHPRTGLWDLWTVWFLRENTLPQRSSAHSGLDHTDPAWGREGIKCKTKEHLSTFLNLLQCLLVQCSVIAHKGGYRCRDRSLTHCQNFSSFCTHKAIALTERVGKGRRALGLAAETWTPAVVTCLICKAKHFYVPGCTFPVLKVTTVILMCTVKHLAHFNSRYPN